MIADDSKVRVEAAVLDQGGLCGFCRAWIAGRGLDDTRADGGAGCCCGAVVAVGLREDWKEDSGVAAVFGLRKKGAAVGLVSCVSGRQLWFGQETEAVGEEEGGVRVCRVVGSRRGNAKVKEMGGSVLTTRRGTLWLGEEDNGKRMRLSIQ
jgi:hypothetical protein